MLSVRSVTPDKLSLLEKDCMYQLLKDHFSGVDRDVFHQDLMRKDIAFLLCTTEGQLKGFSTAEVFHHRYQSKEYQVIFSGDTIVSRDAWGSHRLPLAWLSWARSLERPGTELLWFLISKGVRTYKFLPAFCKEYYPSVAGKNQEFLQGLIYDVARTKFESVFDEQRGVLSVFHGSYALRPDLAEITPAQMKGRHASFFLEKNPGYRMGEELVCCASLEVSNIKPYLLRQLMRSDYQEACYANSA